MTAASSPDGPYAALLAGIDPADLDRVLDDLEPPASSPSGARHAAPPPASASTTAPGMADDEDGCLPSSQPGERALLLLPSDAGIAAPAPDPAVALSLPPPPAAGSTTHAPPSTTTTGPGHPSAPAAAQDAPAHNAGALKRRKVSRESWTSAGTGSPEPDRQAAGPHARAGGRGEEPEEEYDEGTEDDWGFVQPNLPFGSTQTPSTISFLTARGTSFAPPSRAALERAAKFLGSVLSDDEEAPDVREGGGAGSAPGGAVEKGKARARVPLALLDGENGQRAAAADAQGEADVGTSLSQQQQQQGKHPPPSATLLPDRRSGLAPAAPIPLPPPLSQATAPSTTTACPPPAGPGAPAVARPLPLPSHMSATPRRSASPAPSTSGLASPSFPRPQVPISTPLRRVGISVASRGGATPTLGTRAVGTPPPSARARGRKAFATPFKVPLTPGAAASPAAAGGSGRMLGLKELSAAGTPLRAGVVGDQRKTPVTKAASAGRDAQGKKALRDDYPRVFDLTLAKGKKRVSMREAFIRPEFFNKHELTMYDLPEEIAAINLTNAAYYFFTPLPSTFLTTPAPAPQLSYIAALSELVARGCTRLAGAQDAVDWVRNHWELVLWKLACLCRGRPQLFFALPEAAGGEGGARGEGGEAVKVESGSEEEGGEGEGIVGAPGCGKFSWEEVIRQLLYRYEREYNQGHRSCLARVHAHDASPAAPMILCVTSVPADEDLPPPGAAAAGKPAVIELTDGWYRIRAEVDDVLAGAIRRGKLRVGVKIGIAGARLDGKADGSPPLKGLEHGSHLVLTGNGTSLAHWAAPLGFRPPAARPFVASLAALSPEGGTVPLVDVVVEKCFPVGWLDQREDGAPPGEPRDDHDERALRRKWESKYEEEAQAVQDEIAKRLDVLAGLIDRVERVGGGVKPSESGGSAASEDQYDQLCAATDKTTFLRALKPLDAANLGSFMRAKHAGDCARMQQDIAEETEARCPKRNVRSFKIIKVRDAQTTKPALRTAQLCLWDVAQLGEEEEGLVEGKRYLISNLSCGQKRSWVPPRTAGDVYLNSRRDTKWRVVSGG